MKLVLFICLFSVSSFLFAQNSDIQIKLKNLQGKQISYSEIINENKIVVVSFWATWCKPCISELDAINEWMEDWSEMAEFKFVAISIDDSRSDFKIKSMVNGKGWEFEVLLDDNQKLKQKMGVSNIPYSMILNKGKVVYKHSGYLPGDEEILFQEILKLNEN